MRPPEHPPGWENSRRLHTYPVKAHCVNCDKYFDFEVPKGTLAREYLEIQDCPNCECKETLEKE